MSSPSSNGSGKRKRNTTLPSAMNKSSIADLQQPSSRDASGEDAGEDSTAQLPVGTKHKKPAASLDSTNPPAKRPRTRSNVLAEAPSGNGQTIPSINTDDPGEPSDSTEGSTDIVNHSKRKGKPASTREQDVAIEESKAMPPPVKCGLQDPVGYHTNPPPTDRAVRIYADGVFDLFHLGHMRQLEQAKKAFPETYLMVGVTGDVETHKRKGLTVLTGAERAETVRHCKWVDEVIPNCPWIVTAEFLAEHQIDYVAHDDLPYGADEGDDIYKAIKGKGQFLVTQRTEGVSTTGIITKIVRDYEKYIARQFKRGTSRQELNVSWLKKNELDLKRHVMELRDNVRNNWSTTGQELTKELRQFWQSSRPGSPMRGLSRSNSEVDLSSRSKPTSPTAVSHLSHLDIPRQDGMGGPASSDFATGYSLGLIGGVRSWMTRSRVSQRGSRPGSPDGSSDEYSEDQKSPKEEKIPTRGRKDLRSGKAEVEAEAEDVEAMDTKA